MMIEPGQPLQRCQFNGLPHFPGAAMNQFGLEQAVASTSTGPRRTLPLGLIAPDEVTLFHPVA